MPKKRVGRPRLKPPKKGPGSRRSRKFGRQGPDDPRKPGLKWREENIEIVKGYVALDYSEAEIARFLNVSVSQMGRWKHKVPKFAKAFIRGRQRAQAAVERAMFERATGYAYEAEKIFQHQGVGVRVPYTEFMPPDPGAAKIWLQGNAPEKYGDKLELSGNNARPVSFVIEGLGDAPPKQESKKPDERAPVPDKDSDTP